MQKLAIRFNSKDKIEIDLTFINYIVDNEHNNALTMKFELKKGNQLRMYDFIQIIKDKLDDADLIEC